MKRILTPILEVFAALDFRDKFRGGKVTIAIINFPMNNGSAGRFVPARAPLRFWLEEMKLPPLVE